MNALLEHVLGQSPAQDQVWSQVAGLDPSVGEKRFLMALNFQAFMDESVGEEEFVLAGHISTPDRWSLFAREWEELLPYATLSDEGVYRFKMSEMAMNAERMARVRAFYILIEKYVHVSVSVRMNLSEFRNALQRAQNFLLSIKYIVDFAKWEDPYYLATRLLFKNLHEDRDKVTDIMPVAQKIDFIFDDVSEKDLILRSWEGYLDRQDDDVRALYGANPRFERDEEFLPLQAADLWAWWVREWYEDEADEYPHRLREFDFGTWKGIDRPVIVIAPSEDSLTGEFKQIAIENYLREDVLKRPFPIVGWNQT